jgi:hypothetical protein
MLNDTAHRPSPTTWSNDPFLAGTGGVGDTPPLLGEVVRLRPHQPITRSLAGCTVVVDHLQPEIVPFLDGAAGLIVTSSGPWETANPGQLTDDLGRAGLGRLLKAIELPTIWGVGAAADRMRDGDLAEVDPDACAAWWVAL